MPSSESFRIAAVQAKATEKGVDYVTALELVKAETPALFNAYYAHLRGAKEE